MNSHFFSRSGLSLERLKTFCDVVTAAGISHAAPGNLNKQSQFSRQLSQLEEFFGVKLLRRGGGRFELTTAGGELFQIATSHFSALAEFADRCGHRNVQLTIGAGDSLLHWLLLPAFATFRARHPATTLTLENLQTHEIAARLLDGRIEIGLLRQDAVRPPLKSRSLGSIRYRLFVPRTSSKPANGRAVWTNLERHPVALLTGSEITAAFEAEAERKGVRLNVCLRGSSYSQLIEAVRQIGCAAVLPTFAAQPLASTSDIVTIPVLGAFTRSLVLACNPRFSTLRPDVEKVVDSLAEVLRQKLDQSSGEAGVR